MLTERADLIGRRCFRGAEVMTARRWQHRVNTRGTSGYRPGKTPRIRDDGMAAPEASCLTPRGSTSDYGSDIELRDISDYGSEFDSEETMLIGDLLVHIVATTPPEKTIIYPSIEDECAHEVTLHKSPRSAVVQLDSTGLETPQPRERSVSREVEYDDLSREAWSGMNFHNSIHDALSGD